MYTDHPVFKQPPDENEKVWRYMDFTKFVSLLESGALYFTRSDKFSDPFEGSYPRLNVLARQYIPEGLPENAINGYRQMMAKMGDINRDQLKRIAVNCWHLNSHESAAMWRLYLKSDEGIAIQSTYKRLRNCFANVEEEIYIGRVEYIDYETQWMQPGNFYTPFVHKRKSFEHECEVRAVVTRWPEDDDYSKESIADGLPIPVDLGVLIENVYIAPDAPSWLTDLVKSVVNRYSGNYSVIQSNLNQTPLY